MGATIQDSDKRERSVEDNTEYRASIKLIYKCVDFDKTNSKLQLYFVFYSIIA